MNDEVWETEYNWKSVSDNMSLFIDMMEERYIIVQFIIIFIKL